MSRVSRRGEIEPRLGRVHGRYGGRTIALFAGAGGMDQAINILGLADKIGETIGVDLDVDACDTGRAAGHERQQIDVRKLSPKRHRGITGMINTPPCPTFNASGKGTGREDMQRLLDAITCIGMGCGCDWRRLPHDVQDERSALVVEAARWIIECRTLRWFVCEQVLAVQPIWDDITAEAYSHGWEWVDTIQLHAADYGLPMQRKRTFLIGRRYSPPQVSEHDAGSKGADLERYTMGQVLGLQPGTRVWTRNNRRGGGGNDFSADGAGWSLTGSARSWKIGTVDGPELRTAQAGVLQAFPPTYPWQGSRTKRFGQIADVVNPVMGAIALGIATDTPWVEPVRAYLHALYGPGQAAKAPALRPRPAPYQQLNLLDLAA
jgi:DNA (cytosine-5)-methyltransferase 1